MCRCYVVTASIRFIQVTENDDDAAEAELKAGQALDKFPAITVKDMKVRPFDGK